MAHWTASAKWGEAPALDGQCAMPLGLPLNEGLGVCERDIRPRQIHFQYQLRDDTGCPSNMGD
jgi:hypothetical protein